MKKSVQRPFSGPVGSLFMFALFLFEGSALAAQNQGLSVVTEEWAPYNFVENGRLRGLSVDVVRAIAADLQVPIDLQVYPSMRAKAMLEGGSRTFMITMLRTPDREDLYQWIGPLDDSAIYFYKKKGSSLQINSLEDAKQVRSIACRHAGLVPSLLRVAGFTNLEAIATGGRAVYEMLLNDRCDLAISDTPLGVAYLLKQMGRPLDSMVQTGVSVVQAPAYIACSKDIPLAEITQWQGALDRLKASGAFTAIMKRYQE